MGLSSAQELVRQATRAAEFRGHRMSGWNFTYVEDGADGRAQAHAVCKDCLATAHIDTRPAPNGIDIGGTAVALGCSLERAAALVALKETTK